MTITNDKKNKRSFLPHSLRYHLYLLQLENYELRRFWRLLAEKKFISPPMPWRKEIDWTLKLGIICILTVTILIIFINFVVLIILLYIFLHFNFVKYALSVSISIATIIFWPFDSLVKHLIIWRAKLKLRHFPNLKIVGIAGSYGKTTVKEFIAGAIKEEIRILVTPENINTPLGIARLILNKLEASTQVFIVEMGEYYRGDIKQICALTPPDIAVVTGINEAHLERLKNIETTAATIFEVVEYSRAGAQIVFNADDANIKKYFNQYTKSRPFSWYGKSDNNNNQYPTKFLASYALGSAFAAVMVGRLLGVKDENMRRGIMGVEPIAHRLQPLNGANGVLVIDDSYNGNPEGVREAIEVLAEYHDRRRIFLTPGLVEIGAKSASIHREIGAALAKVANLVILIKNSVTPFIYEGLKSAGFNESGVIWYNTAPEAHQDLGKIIKSGDVVLFQNDWGDNYV